MMFLHVFGKNGCSSLILSLVTLYTFLAQAHPHDAARSDPRPLAKRDTTTTKERAFHKFVTRPDIDAPVYNVKVHNKEALAPGYWFVAPYGNLGQPRPGNHWVGPHIYDNEGELIWSGAPMFGYWNAFDFRTATINGETMLTLLSDHEQRGFMINSSYQVHKTVPFLYGEETKVNMHEFNIIDDGKTALLLTLEPIMTSVDVSKVVGVNKPCDAKYQGFREVDLAGSETPQETFHWEAIGHIELDEPTFKTHDGTFEQMCTKGWDILHFNSIVKFPDGDYLLSSRHTDTIYKISATDGEIIWRLGGKKGDFELFDDWKFSRQHDAKILESNTTHTTISFFDNGIGDGPFDQGTNPVSRGLIVQLDTQTMNAKILAEYNQPDGGRTNARGSFQHLSNGNKFFCWAYHTSISEHAEDGEVLMEAKFDKFLTTYRAYKSEWVGAPAAPPDIYTEALYLGPNDQSQILTVIHVSWNGDTRATRWRFRGVDKEGKEYHLGEIPRDGFETRFEYKGFARNVFAVALDGYGEKIGKSEVGITEYPEVRGEGMGDSGLHQPEFVQDEKEGTQPYTTAHGISTSDPKPLPPNPVPVDPAKPAEPVEPAKPADPQPPEPVQPVEPSPKPKPKESPSRPPVVDTSSSSDYHNINNYDTFGTGLFFGGALGGLVWLFMRYCRGRRLGKKGKGPRYMPLGEDD